MTLRALDATVVIDAPDSELEWLMPLFADLHVARHRRGARVIRWKSVDGGWRVTIDGRALHKGVVDRSEALVTTLRAINLSAVESLARRAVALHAGAFTIDGRAIAVVGTSMSGKSTVVAEAVRNGCGYLADEVVAVTRRGTVARAFHRPIGLRPDAAERLGVRPGGPDDAFLRVVPWAVSGGDAGLAPGMQEVDTPLRLIVVLERRPGPVEVQPLRPDEALAALVTSTFRTRSSRQALRDARHLANDIPIARANYPEAGALLETLSSQALQAVCRRHSLTDSRTRQ